VQKLHFISWLCSKEKYFKYWNRLMIFGHKCSCHNMVHPKALFIWDTHNFEYPSLVFNIKTLSHIYTCSLCLGSWGNGLNTISLRFWRVVKNLHVWCQLVVSISSCVGIHFIAYQHWKIIFSLKCLLKLIIFKEIGGLLFIISFSFFT